MASTQMSPQTKNTIGPLLGMDERYPAADIWTGLYEAVGGVGVEHCPVLATMFEAIVPVAERISFLDARIARYDERVYARIDQLRRELREPLQVRINEPAASHRILAEDAQEAANDATERRMLYAELARLCALATAVHFHLTGDDSRLAIVRTVAAAG